MYVIRLWLVPHQSNENDVKKQKNGNHSRLVQTIHCTDFVPEPGEHIQDLISRLKKRIQHKQLKGRQTLLAYIGGVRE